MKKQVRVCMLHPLVKNAEDLSYHLHLNHVDELPYELIWDDVHPDFVIATELFYMDPRIRKKFAELYCDQVITIFLAGECIAPDLNLFDYAIGFGNYDSSERIICHPYRAQFREYLKESFNIYAGKIDLAYENLSRKTGFCNFICSNPNGHKSREEIFHMISSYKKIDSLGSFLNNTSLNDASLNSSFFQDEREWSYTEKVRNSIYLKEKYKFTIAFENQISRGYTSEKIFMALEAHSIPIYWGNPEIGKIVNEKAIINCHQYENFQQVLERVKEIDQNDSLWCQMVSEPWMTEEQMAQELAHEREYYDFLERIFLEKHTTPAKRGSGTFASVYSNFIFGDEKSNEIYMAKFCFCMDWIRLHHQGKGLNDFFQNKNYKTVAIYGMSDIGIAAYKEIKNCETVQKIYGIDRALPPVPKDMICFHLYEVTEEMHPDAVVITVLRNQEEIAEDIQKHFSCDVYNIEDIVKNTVREKSYL